MTKVNTELRHFIAGVIITATSVALCVIAPIQMVFILLGLVAAAFFCLISFGVGQIIASIVDKD